MTESIVYELPFDLSDVARSLFGAATFDRTFIDAYFEGRQAGRLFVDDPAQPAGALLCRSYDYFLAGEPVESIKQIVSDAPSEAGVFDVVHDLDAARRAPTIAFYGYVPVSSTWHEALIALHGDRLETIGRRSFRFERDDAEIAADWRTRIPEGFSVQLIDSALAERIDTELGEVIGLFWGGYERFGAGGFGACVMRGSDIASIAYTSAVSDREINIGVETASSFRRLGLASIVSLACIAEALDRGLTPTWDCDRENVASGALAIRLGFPELPSFVELAFPHRSGPAVTSGQWSGLATNAGISWRRR